ncbi:histidine phosphatase family protein [Paenibacillus sp. CF384]|uniref:histidine phosphatase family protein n=1 Tax=Paenibacillus sp. CF384 TaxID=1884382 RepID=UPI00089A4A97|nr:histidine phosphatase family protein [Paenibacillus sp. CF384]SDW15386.1 probable phosphoglycerate mutase [Paenibacillus sp. CF384]
MTKFGLIRHGETDWNTEGRAQGQSDIALNDTGRLQAHTLAERLRNESWDVIFSSDLSRAKETADIVAKLMGLTVLTDSRLREMYKGEMEGTTLKERIQKWGEQWERLAPGLESEDSIVSRGTSFIAEAAETYKGKNILVFSHGVLIGSTLKHFIPSIDTKVHIVNTSVTTITRSGSKWECELFNCSKHVV